MAGIQSAGDVGVLKCAIVLLIFRMTAIVSGLQCIANDNRPVDWFIGYKLPGSSNVPANSLMYLDARSQRWQLVAQTLDQNNQAIYNTLNQIYTPSQSLQVFQDSVMYAMYNDEPPGGHASTSHGHTKGVVGFDPSTGFWLVQSTPKFPPARSSGYDWPESAHTYAQSFLCISLATSSNLNEIGKQFLYNWPLFYDKNLPSAFASKYPELANALASKHVQTGPWNRQTTLHSLAGVTFTSFAKFNKWDQDLYADWLAPTFHDSLLVETWQNGINPMCSNCSGTYRVMNIKGLQFSSPSIAFKETQDHAKWAITNTTGSAWVCVGDINRQESQMTRPGGTVCFQNQQVHASYQGLITQLQSCGDQDKCVPAHFGPIVG
ncbi:plancitoxin-1-like isoform X3 [Dreissena polymorpha]|uniref:plancitoxin-1-like isoform X3 n=1 Tax=Dreissena polymorpha TaxID=45954 RepID=UPI0022651A38|nr:plancitoxin-1-like isoform X3 [Dreissena polymorpha]